MLLIQAVFLLAGCNRPKNTPVLSFDSFPEMLQLSGKTLSEGGLTKDDMTDGIYLLIETVFLDETTEVRGYSDHAGGERIGELTFTSKKRLSEAQAYFKELYGEPYETEIQPYAKSKGGSVYREYYWTGEGILILSKADHYGYIEVRYRNSDQPENDRSHEN